MSAGRGVRTGYVTPLAAAIVLACLCRVEGQVSIRGLYRPAVQPFAELWQDPVDLSKRNLYYGPWGQGNAPEAQATYSFIRRKANGTNPGMVVMDHAGREWHVKQGREGGPEVVVSRVLSAVGYHQPPVYFLPSFTVAKANGTKVVDGGRFRLKTASMHQTGEWSWYENPFAGSQPFQGLLVILVMLNSSDLKNVNNALYELNRPIGGATRWFIVRDLGTSLGAVGRTDPKPNDIDRFERHPFIIGVEDGFVRFDYSGVHSDLVKRSIRPADVKWASRLLARITDAQWGDAFRAGGYPPGDATRYVRRIREKIAAGMEL